MPKHDDFITTHFRYNEFLDSAVFDDLQEPGEAQQWLTLDWLLYRMCKDHLEPIRAIIEEPIIVNDGVRTLRDTERLEAMGYEPNPKSDHSYGLRWNPLGVGAADIIPARTGRFTGELFHHVVGVRTETPDDPPWGQFIYYPDRGHCHVANRRDVLYSAVAQRGLPFVGYHARTYVKE